MQTKLQVLQEGRPEPQVTSLGDIYRHSGYKALQQPCRPGFWGVDKEMARRPGVPSHREPQLWPNAQLEIVPMDPATSAPFKHGRPNREWPPVFGTVCQPKGLSGLVRKWASSFPDHKPQHWLLKLLGDRVDSFEHRLAKLGPMAIPLAAALAGGIYLARRRKAARSGGWASISALRSNLRKAVEHRL